jgi:chromosome segregation ATPase
MMGRRTFGRAAEPAPEITEAESAAAVPDDLAAAAEQLRAEAADLEARADRGDREVKVMIAAADEEAENLKAAARQQALGVQAEATAARREAAQRAEQERLITAAKAEQDRGAEAVQRGAELEAERVQLLDTIADLDGKLADLRTNREEAEVALVHARSAADVDRVTALRSRLAGVDDLAEALARERQQASDRAQEVGDGTGATGEHGAACSAAASHYAKATELLDLAYPDTEDAAQRRWLADLHATIEANMERIAEESAAAAKPQPRQIVHL